MQRDEVQFGRVWLNYINTGSGISTHFLSDFAVFSISFSHSVCFPHQSLPVGVPTAQRRPITHEALRPIPWW